MSKNAQTKFEEFVLQKGLRQTRPREKVLEVFWATERHVSVQDLYDLVRKKYPGIGYATVSRTLKLLSEAGICRIVDLGDGVQRFEHKFGHEHHDHLICTRCGRFVEIFSPPLEKFQDQLVKKHGFVQEYHKLDIFGLCPKCQKRGGLKR